MGIEGSFTVSILQFSVSMRRCEIEIRESHISQRTSEMWGTPFRWYIAPSVIEVRKAQGLKSLRENQWDDLYF